MTVKELQGALAEALSKGVLRHDSKVVMSCDSEGNEHSEAMELTAVLVVGSEVQIDIVGYTDKHGVDIFFDAKPQEYETALVMVPMR